MLYFHSIACCKNIRRRGFHTIVYHNASFDTKLQSRLFCKVRIRRNADRKDHHICLQRLLVLQKHAGSLLAFFKAFHCMAKHQLYTPASHFCMYKSCHISVKRVHKLLWSLDYGNVQSQLPEIFRKLQANISASGKHCRLWLFFLHKLPDFQSIFYCTKGKKIVQICSGKLRPYRFCSSGNKKFIINLLKTFPCIQIFYCNCFSLRKNPCHLMPHLHGDLEALPEAFRGLKSQFFLILDHTANIVGKSAVCIGNIT